MGWLLALRGSITNEGLCSGGRKVSVSGKTISVDAVAGPACAETSLTCTARFGNNAYLRRKEEGACVALADRSAIENGKADRGARDVGLLEVGR